MTPFDRSKRFLVVAIILLFVACAADEQLLPARLAQTESGINFATLGRGQPIVLVHGFSQTHEFWFQTSLLDDLGRGHKIIAVDVLGHGDSQKPHDPVAYGTNMQAKLVGLLDELSIEKAHFVGFSMGASVVGGLLTSHPERVQTAVMGSGFFTTWDPAEEEFAEYTEGREQTGERFPWEPKNQDFKALAAAIRGAQYATISDKQIATIETPTLIVFGSIEIDHMSETQRQRLNGLPLSIDTLIIDGADHDSDRAAIMNPAFLQAALRLIGSNPIQ